MEVTVLTEGRYGEAHKTSGTLVHVEGYSLKFDVVECRIKLQTEAMRNEVKVQTCGYKMHVVAESRLAKCRRGKLER
jgi:hypothetical protein